MGSSYIAIKNGKTLDAFSLSAIFSAMDVPITHVKNLGDDQYKYKERGSDIFISNDGIKGKISSSLIRKLNEYGIKLKTPFQIYLKENIFSFFKKAN